MKFAHLADVHLGYRQYNLVEREADYLAAFEATMGEISRRGVDFVVIAGDLFNSRVIRPDVWQQAINVLDVPFPVFVVEGNHDKAVFSDDETWVTSLKGLVAVLGRDSEPRYVGDVRLVGLSYRGPREREALVELAESLEPYSPTVLICHVGVADSCGLGGLAASDLKAILEGKVDYVATGHYHYPWTDGFVFQPGALVPTAIDQPHGGFYLSDFETTEFVPLESYHGVRQQVTERVATLAEAERLSVVEGSILRLIFTQESPTRSQVEAVLSAKPLKLSLSYDVAIEVVEDGDVETGVLSSLTDEVEIVEALKVLALEGASPEEIVEFLEEKYVAIL